MKTVIEMAREAGLIVATGFDDGPSMAISIPTGSWGVEEIERFAELVRTDEREACAQLCEDQWQTAHDIQDAIRARSNT